MARYNTSYPITVQSGGTTIVSPDAGQFTRLTGTAPYTVNLPDPIINTGAHLTFWNNTSGNVTLSTPNGVIRNMTTTEIATWVMVPDTIISLASDGTDYIGYNFTGGPVYGTNGTFTGNVTITGTLGVENNTTMTGDLTVNGGDIVLGGTGRIQGIDSVLAGTDAVNRDYVQNRYGKDWVIQSSNVTATSGSRYFVNTGSTALTITLPSSPSAGDWVQFIDYAGTFNVRALTVARNGQPIMRITDNMTVSTQGAAFTLVYANTSVGWLIDAGI